MANRFNPTQMMRTYLNPHSDPAEIAALDVDFAVHLNGDPDMRQDIQDAMADRLTDDEAVDWLRDGLQDPDTVHALLSYTRAETLMERTLFARPPGKTAEKPATPAMEDEFLMRLKALDLSPEQDLLTRFALHHVNGLLNDSGQHVVDKIKDDPELYAVYQDIPLRTAVLDQSTQYLRHNPVATYQQFLDVKSDTTHAAVKDIVAEFQLNQGLMEKTFEQNRSLLKRSNRLGDSN